MNTERVVMKNTSMQHIEGGWPKDVDFTEQSDVKRFRKKASIWYFAYDYVQNGSFTSHWSILELITFIITFKFRLRRMRTFSML